MTSVPLDQAATCRRPPTHHKQRGISARWSGPLLYRSCLPPQRTAVSSAPTVFVGPKASRPLRHRRPTRRHLRRPFLHLRAVPMIGSADIVRCNFSPPARWASKRGGSYEYGMPVERSTHETAPDPVAGPRRCVGGRPFDRRHQGIRCVGLPPAQSDPGHPHHRHDLYRRRGRSAQRDDPGEYLLGHVHRLRQHRRRGIRRWRDGG